MPLPKSPRFRWLLETPAGERLVYLSLAALRVDLRELAGAAPARHLARLAAGRYYVVAPFSTGRGLSAALYHIRKVNARAGDVVHEQKRFAFAEPADARDVESVDHGV